MINEAEATTELAMEWDTDSTQFVKTADWCAAFVRTSDEQRIAKWLQSELGEKYVVFTPTKDGQYFDKKNKTFRTSLHRRALFPGYVFIAASSMDLDDVFIAIESLVRRRNNIYYLVKNGMRESGLALMSDDDKALLSRLLDNEFNIPALEAVMEGDMIIVTDEALLGMEGRVKHIDKRKRVAKVEFDMFGRPTVVSMAINLMEKAVGQ